MYTQKCIRINNLSQWRKIFILINNVVIITYQLPMVFLPIKFIYNINNTIWTNEMKWNEMRGIANIASTKYKNKKWNEIKEMKRNDKKWKYGKQRWREKRKSV